LSFLFDVLSSILTLLSFQMSLSVPAMYEDNARLVRLLDRAADGFKSRLHVMGDVSPVAGEGNEAQGKPMRIEPKIAKPEDLELDIDTAEGYSMSVAEDGRFVRDEFVFLFSRQ
jgi:hypothetical protein